jgi:FkbM family methyltransferase
VFATEDTLEFDAPRPGEQILNLGVFSGHELPYLAALVGGRGTIHCIDPDGLDLLSDYTRALVTACPERIREARFTAGGYAPDRGAADGCSSSTHARSARATRHRASPISTVDSYVESSGIRSIGFIKIDIHGMEQAALDGLAHTLAAHRPTLSVAISARPEHLWSLPLRLMTTLRRYEFHISHRSPVRWKTLLTAVPIERAAKARRSSPQAR